MAARSAMLPVGKPSLDKQHGRVKRRLNGRPIPEEVAASDPGKSPTLSS